MFVSKKKVEQVQHQLESVNALLHTRDEELTALKSLYDSMLPEFNKIVGEKKDLLGQIDNLANPEITTGGAETTFTISPDLLTLTPFIRYDPEIFEKLVELGYLNDTHGGNKFAIQLAILTVTHEALTQIIESFSENLKE